MLDKDGTLLMALNDLPRTTWGDQEGEGVMIAAWTDALTHPIRTSIAEPLSPERKKGWRRFGG
jgi:hypothetical protein